MEETTGGRLIQNYNVIGGVMADIHPNLINRIKEFIKYLPPMIKEYHDVFTGNVIAQQRLKGVGVLKKRTPSVTGHPARQGAPAGGHATCVNTRRTGVYDKVDFKNPLPGRGLVCPLHGAHGRDSRIITYTGTIGRQHPAGDCAVKTKPLIKLPEGHYFKSVEASRGEFGVYLESRGDKIPLPGKIPFPVSATGIHRRPDHERR